MNRLHPDLKQWLRRARAAEADRSAEAPYGFANRVVANWKLRPPEPPPLVRSGLFTSAAWTSGVILLGCGLLLSDQLSAPKLATDFSLTAQWLARSLVP